VLGAIYIGLSGMTAYSKGLQTISNNVANLNTPGYKATSVAFADVFNGGGVGSSYMGTNASRLGDGVKYADPSVDFGQGDLRATDGELDLALQGNGLLVLLDGDKTYFTRTGQFVVDDEGYIVEQASGYKLAVLNSSNQPEALNIESRRASPPVATTQIEFGSNIARDSAVDTVISNITVYDASGAKHVWTATIHREALDADSKLPFTVTVTDQTGATIGTGLLKFDGTAIDPTSAIIAVTTSAADGVAGLSVNLDFSAVTAESGGTSTVRTTDIDGRAPGALVSASIDTDGQVKLTYSNEHTELLGYVAIADFRDPQSLERIGNGMFENVRNGDYRLLASGTFGIGKLVGGQMEASNVDLSEQFGDLILIQRGFQASSQVVSVSNDMIQQLFGIRGQG